jgi:predicted transposase YdaD
MKTDAYCKKLAHLRPDDLLVLLCHTEAHVLSLDIVELREIKRTVDFVFKLQRGDELYFLHVEFQAEPEPELIPRCFLYNTQLVLQYKVPVITVIISLFDQRPWPEPVFRVMVGGQEINRWTFQCLRLWELESETVLAQGLPGLAALVPLMNGSTLDRVEQAASVLAAWTIRSSSSTLDRVEQAAQQIERLAPKEHQADLFAILRAFGESKYTVGQLERIIGRERIMESSFYREARAEGLAEGVMAGQLTGAREFCREVVRHYHPRAGKSVWKAIDHCTDLAALKEVTVHAAEWSPRQIVQRLTAQ